MASGLTHEQVEIMLVEHSLLTSMTKMRDEMSENLGRLSFEIHLQHAKLSGYFASPLLRLAFLTWADRNMVSDDIETRRSAQTIRGMLDRNNHAPLFKDASADVKKS